MESLKAVKSSKGTFRALLLFRVESGDAELSEHLKTASKKATYLSKEIQNELIKLCGQEILQKIPIIQEINAVTFFSVIADETSDNAHVEQLCLYLRYVSEDCVVKEQFISFGDIENCPAQGISNEILPRLANSGLPIENGVGQDYNGASVMAGYKGGVQAFIREKALSALYVHCASNALNLVLNHGSDVMEIRNMFKIVSDTINFVNDSPKRRALFDRNLTKMRGTRFVQRRHSILKFRENFQKITEELGKILIDASFDTNTRSRALSLLEAVCSSSFLVAMAAAVKVMAVTQPLSKILQKVQLCYAEAIHCVQEVRNTLSSWRSDDNEWKGNYFSVFNTVQRYADIAGIEIKKPCCPSRLVYRSSFKDCTVKGYFRYSVWYPYLDGIIAEFATKFSKESLSAHKLISVLLSSNVDVSDCLIVFKMYGRLIHCQEQALFEELKAFSLCRATKLS